MTPLDALGAALLVWALLHLAVGGPLLILTYVQRRRRPSVQRVPDPDCLCIQCQMLRGDPDPVSYADIAQEVKRRERLLRELDLDHIPIDLLHRLN